MKSGQQFERQFRTSCKKDPDLFFYRLKDSPSMWGSVDSPAIRFTNDNICDCVLFKSPILFLIELKSHSGSSLPFSCIRKNQIEGLLESSKYKNVVPGVICFFTDKSRCFFLHITKLKELQDSNIRKSIPIKYFEDFGVEIEVENLRVNYLLEIHKFVDGFVKGAQNG